MYKLSLHNSSKAMADINLFSGGRLVIQPSTSLPLPEEEKLTSELERYYSQMRVVGIHLVKLRVEDPVKPSEEEGSVDPVGVTQDEVFDNTAELVSSEVEGPVEGVLVEDVIPGASEESQEVPFKERSVEDLMKNYTKLELLNHAKKMGIEVPEEANTKKEISQLLLASIQ